MKFEPDREFLERVSGIPHGMGIDWKDLRRLIHMATMSAGYYEREIKRWMTKKDPSAEGQAPSPPAG